MMKDDELEFQQVKTLDDLTDHLNKGAMESSRIKTPICGELTLTVIVRTQWLVKKCNDFILYTTFLECFARESVNVNVLDTFLVIKRRQVKSEQEGKTSARQAYFCRKYEP